MLKATFMLIGLFLILWGSVVFADQSNVLPRHILKQSVEVTEYDGRSLRDPRPNDTPPFAGYPDDLLSGGLNGNGLQSPAAPAFADPSHPTATELRRLAIYANYRAIADMATEGGYGIFWGPDIAPDFGPDIEHGLIPGVEYTAVMKLADPSRNINTIPLAVQIPDHFDLDNPCIFLAPPSGSRGYYGGIAVAEWGLFNGCAVVLPGKGTGTGFHHLSDDKAYNPKGVLTAAGKGAEQIQFAVKKNRKLKKYIAANPHRIAAKHAHSQINCEQLWGDAALNGIEFAFWVLNDWFGQIIESPAYDENGEVQKEKQFHPGEILSKKNTLVIASGTSNGAAAALRALEKDRDGLIDGLVVIEPNINPDSAGKFTIEFGEEPFSGHGTSLLDNATLMGIFAPCAALSASLENTPCNLDPIGAPEEARSNRCEALHRIGLLKSATMSEQADEALSILRAHGYYAEQETLLAAHEWLNLWRSLSATYAAAHGRFAVWENIGAISFAAIDPETGKPAPISAQGAAALFSNSNGIPPTSEINLINDAAANGPILENLSISPTSNLEDLNLDGALYFRYLATGNPELLVNGRKPEDFKNFARVQKGIKETLTTADLHGTPAMILTGRSDSLVFPNYHSRPYYGLNQSVEGADSSLRYIEVLNAQHFDAFISTFWLDPATREAQFVPLHYYLFKALDRMYAYLKKEIAELPPSQVVRPQPRGLAAYTRADADSELLPEIKAAPDPEDLITFDGAKLTIPK